MAANRALMSIGLVLFVLIKASTASDGKLPECSVILFKVSLVVLCVWASDIHCNDNVVVSATNFS